VLGGEGWMEDDVGCRYTRDDLGALVVCFVMAGVFTFVLRNEGVHCCLGVSFVCNVRVELSSTTTVPLLYRAVDVAI